MIHHLQHPKNYRYATNGYVNSAKEVWFVLHGYGQLCNYFLNTFDYLTKNKIGIIAPEGAHRFYLQGTGGKVGASWMTKEDREVDIADYISFLDALYTKRIKPHQTVHVLGFSQGTATACRWIANGKSKAQNLILWAGMFPPDIENPNFGNILKKLNMYLAISKKDPFYKEDLYQNQIKLIEEANLNPTIFNYEGVHNIEKVHFRQFIETHINPIFS